MTGWGAEHPPLDQHDVWSWLDGSLGEHKLIAASRGLLRLDGSPELEHPEELSCDDLCRSCSFKRARRVGYDGPFTLRIAYDSNPAGDPEPVMVLRRDDQIALVATYSYGRAYFEPGEQRAAPCADCGHETLISGL